MFELKYHLQNTRRKYYSKSVQYHPVFKLKSKNTTRTVIKNSIRFFKKNDEKYHLIFQLKFPIEI